MIVTTIDFQPKCLNTLPLAGQLFCLQQVSHYTCVTSRMPTSSPNWTRLPLLMQFEPSLPMSLCTDNLHLGREPFLTSGWAGTLAVDRFSISIEPSRRR